MKKKTWLIVFNFITLVAWWLFVVVFFLDEFQLTARASVVLALAQGLAIIEIAHAIMGIAGSNWMMTLLQVSSRFFITFLVMLMASNCPCIGLESFGYPLIAVAWSLTEIVRALNYLGDLLNKSWENDNLAAIQPVFGVLPNRCGWRISNPLWILAMAWGFGRFNSLFSYGHWRELRGVFSKTIWTHASPTQEKTGIKA
jgi:hypothetical protein